MPANKTKKMLGLSGSILAIVVASQWPGSSAHQPSTSSFSAVPMVKPVALSTETLQPTVKPLQTTWIF